MKIILTHGYFLKEDKKEQKIMRPYPPLGLLYISAYLEMYAMDNEVFDSTFSTLDQFKEYLNLNKPDVLALYTNLMTKINVIQMMKLAKKITPGVKIILGGPDVTYNTADYLRSGADYIVIGEGEETMLELVRFIKGDFNDQNSIDGIAYLDADGHEIKTKPRQKLKDINSLPLPNRNAIDLQLYLNAWKDFHGESALNVSTQRGCPYTCKWCSTAVYGQSYRRRNPAKVVEELKEIQSNYNPDTIWFVDDVFTISHKWLNQFADELERNDVKIKFECISRADRMNADVIKTLKRAGCFRVWIGAESGSQKIIDAMDRRVSVGQVRDMIRESKKSGIETGTFIMLGYPGETESDILETIHHLKDSNPDYFTITIAYPIKGTALYDEIEAIQTKDLDWEHSTDRDRQFSRTYPDRYYQFAVRHVVNEVNAHKQLKHRLSFGGIKSKLKSESALMAMKMIRKFPAVK